MTQKVAQKQAVQEVVGRVALTAADLGLTESQRKAVAPETFSLDVRRLLQNWRQGTVACKGRDQVSGSNKKPWKQKGTGRARAGAVTSPLWRGGGVSFGPQERSRMLKINKDVRRRAAHALLWNALDKNAVTVLDWTYQNDTPKTKHAFEALKQVGMHTQRVNLFLSPHDLVTAASFANIPFVRIIFFDAVNTYHLADASQWIVLKNDIESFKEMVARWI